MSSHSTFAYRKLARLLPGIALLAAVTTGRTDPSDIDRVTEALLAEALDANLGLQAVEAGVAERFAALEQARARFLPAIDLQLRFSRAEGGREIEIPIGGLDNPSFRFQREREQDSLVRLTQPLHDARVSAASRAAAHAHDASRFGLEAARLQLARDVRQAYYRWLATGEAVTILQATRELAAENRRVNDSLHRNGKVTRDLVLRAEADLLEVEQQLLRAQATETLARRYVNLLCNAPLDRPLEAAAVTAGELPGFAARIRPPSSGAVPMEDTAIARRAELRELDAGLRAAAEQEQLARAAFRPQLSLALDAGTQGPRWNYGDDDPYVLASLVVRFNLWNGGADRAALAAARARSRQLGASRELAAQRIRLEVQEAQSALAVAEASLQTAERRAEAAAAAFTIVARKRDLGQVPPAEYLDAERALTAARQNANVTRFDFLSAVAQLGYAIGRQEQSR